jgi:hypothetical protein
MVAALGALAVAAALTAPGNGLPQLPTQGLLVATPGGVNVLNVNGRTLARLEGLRFEPEYVLNSGVPRLRDRQGRLWSLDIRRHRLVRARGGLPLAGGSTLLFGRRAKAWLVLRDGRIVLRMTVGEEFPFLSEDRDVVSTGRRAMDLRTRGFLGVPRGCVLPSRRVVSWILLCGRTEHGTVLPTSIETVVGGRRRRIAGPAATSLTGPAGYWTFVRVSPDRLTLLAQWSGECESPAAFVVSRDRKLRPAGGPSLSRAPESRALGWTRAGRELVSFDEGPCAGSSRGVPGVYALDRSRTPRLVVATKPRQRVAFWG